MKDSLELRLFSPICYCVLFHLSETDTYAILT